jgi:hypothetical protein
VNIIDMSSPILFISNDMIPIPVLPDAPRSGLGNRPIRFRKFFFYSLYCLGQSNLSKNKLRMEVIGQDYLGFDFDIKN